MVALSKREQIINKVLNELTEDEIQVVFDYLQNLHDLSEAGTPPPNNPLEGFFADAPDFAEQSQAVLRAEYGVEPSGDSSEE
jgi:hypothetical protein